MSIFSKVPDAYNVKKNKFPLNIERLTTANFGKIYPVYSQIYMPGSYIKIEPAAVIKTAPLFAPIYSSFNVKFHAFAVPLRLLWSDFYDWVYNPEDTEKIPPHISGNNISKLIAACRNATHSLPMDFGLPIDHAVDDEDKEPLIIWDWLAYHKIYDEYFRNENLEDENVILADPSIQNYDEFFDSDPTLFTHHHYSNYRKDYFTSALPWAQKGTQAFLSVLQSLDSPVVFKNNIVNGDPVNEQFNLTVNPVTNAFRGYVVGDLSVSSHLYEAGDKTAGQSSPHQNEIAGRLYTDLSSAAAGISAHDFRALFAVESYLEQLAVGGSRYPEGTLSFYNVHVRDARAQRPEFLGMMQTVVSPKEVVAHESDTLGVLGAFGQGAATGNRFRYFTTEHTIIVILMSINTNSLYFQGMPKKFRLKDQFDYPIPMFQHLGEEPIRGEEIYYRGDGDNDYDTWGYQSRYAYWRSSRNEICGDFAYNPHGTLSVWHAARIFQTAPALDTAFIKEKPSDISRIFNVTDVNKTEQFWCSLFFKVTSKLPFRYHSRPMLIG